MKQTVKRAAPGLYTRTYKNAEGGNTMLYYGRVKSKATGKRESFPLGTDDRAAKDRLQEIKIANRRGEDLSRFKPEKKIEPKADEPKAMTFSEWAKEYPRQQGVKDKRSLNDGTDPSRIRLHLEPFFGTMPLAEITRKRLVEYIEAREKEKTIRSGKPSKKPVARGTTSNELSLLRHMLRVYNREHDDEKIVIPSFDDLIKRVKRGGRALDMDERKKVLVHYPKWLARMAEFATETCLSEGDILRLTEPMIDRDDRVIVPDDGRMKIQGKAEDQPKQIAPLTDRALEIIDEILAERRKSAKQSGVPVIGPLFTREDGRRISRDMISRGVEQAWKKAEVKKFVFHNYRNTALTDWADQGIHVDVAMQSSGHISVQMHKNYMNLKKHHIAKAFGLKRNGEINGEKNRSTKASSAASS